jgi:hypothetical protein
MHAIAGPDASTICVDSTEVTNAQYAQFLMADAGLNTQPSTCSSNTSFAPGVNSACPSNIDDPVTRGSYPVSCVDWCDAFAFCAWAGKHLCANVHGAPINVTLPPSDTPVSYYACTNGRTTAYEYGNAYVSGVCNDSFFNPAMHGVIPVASDTKCHGVSGPYAQTFDLTGNVAEFQDNGCTSGGGCLALGSTYVDAEPGCFDTMMSPIIVGPTIFSPILGFRCCDVH